MAERNPRVMEYVQQRISKKPSFTPTTLHKKASELDPSLKDVSVRHFNAVYVLPAKRLRQSKAAKEKKGRARSGRGDGAQPSAPDTGPASAPHAARTSARDRTRAVLIDFAQALAAAESRSDIVRVLAGVDEYVERIGQITNGR